ncbi:pentatricopeptide repeat-containing protein At1g34160 [Argentina anserina]|uniref:pentatricopeptide repeat-containing protein At1g34160 n=1 Tax=Argentina anserina TaxID=57926 RepID=UPI0021767966|nr:pentatricopeptide repeat-containing protein At1g34160 [Potentilla anserina]
MPPALLNSELFLQKCDSLTKIKQLQSHLITHGRFQFYPSITIKLLELCALPPIANLPHATALFHHLHAPSTRHWNAVLRGLAQSVQPTQAVSWYAAMSRSSRRVDALTCSFALKACARALASFEALQIHAQVVRFGFGGDVLLGTTLLDVYAKVGNLVYAQKVFDEMPERDVACWNALVSGLAQGSRSGEALALFWTMTEDERLKPNEVTVLGALSACSQLGALRGGEKIHGYIVDTKLDTHVIVCNAVIDMYAKCGSVDRAYRVFEGMKCGKQLITWNTMIMAFAMHGYGEKALEIFEEMGRNGVCCDAVSYLGALCACNHGGLVEDGVRLFNSMAGRGMVPNVKHYGTVVDLLGRAGRLQEAYEIVKSMPIFPDVVLWQTLLGASKTYGDVNMAEMASRRLVELGSEGCGDYVLLSNVYAAHERWDDVGKVREAMQRRDVKKIPGFGYIEVEGVIHKFLNGDQTHVNSCEIYSKLDEIKFKIKDYGYVAKTDQVFHDIGEEEKENALGYHCEKLAVAFGLISTSEGTPIQVIKNLRICDDCHVVMKLVSKAYNREIIVRDRARFHRFQDGLCSCRDYW